jgi:hypothetical protein
MFQNWVLLLNIMWGARFSRYNGQDHFLGVEVGCFKVGCCFWLLCEVQHSHIVVGMSNSLVLRLDVSKLSVVFSHYLRWKTPMLKWAIQDSNCISHSCNLGSLNNLWLNLKLCLKHAMTNSTIYLFRKVVSFVCFSHWDLVNHS